MRPSPRTTPCAPFTPMTSKARGGTFACSSLSSGEGPAFTTRNEETHVCAPAISRSRSAVKSAVKEAHVGALDEAQMLGYFAAASTHMINTPD
jgi:hypothetical protein